MRTQQHAEFTALLRMPLRNLSAPSPSEFAQRLSTVMRQTAEHVFGWSRPPSRPSAPLPSANLLRAAVRLCRCARRWLDTLAQADYDAAQAQLSVLQRAGLLLQVPSVGLLLLRSPEHGLQLLCRTRVPVFPHSLHVSPGRGSVTRYEQYCSSATTDTIPGIWAHGCELCRRAPDGRCLLLCLVLRRSSSLTHIAFGRCTPSILQRFSVLNLRLRRRILLPPFLFTRALRCRRLI